MTKNTLYHKALEELGLTDSDDAFELQEDQILVNQAEILLTRLAANQEAAVAIEAMCTLFKGSEASDLSKTTLKLANMAYGAHVQHATIDLQEMPLDVKGFDLDPLGVVRVGVQSMAADKDRVFDELRKDLGKLLLVNAKQRQVLNDLIKGAKSLLHSLQETLDRGRTPKEGLIIAIGDYSRTANLLVQGRLVAKGGAVASTVGYFLTEHTHLFKRLIKQQIDWVALHKDNLLRTSKGFEGYSFDPVNYLVAGCVVENKFADLELVDGERLWCAPALPGDKAMRFVTPEQVVFGSAALNALVQARVGFGQVGTGAAQTAGDNLPVLTREECQARLAETSMLLDSVVHWAEMAYVKMWKDADFEETFLAAILKDEVLRVSERQLSELGFGVTAQLQRASMHVGEYSMDVVFGLLEYVQASLEAGV